MLDNLGKRGKVFLAFVVIYIARNHNHVGWVVHMLYLVAISINVVTLSHRRHHTQDGQLLAHFNHHLAIGMAVAGAVEYKLMSVNCALDAKQTDIGHLLTLRTNLGVLQYLPDIFLRHEVGSLLVGYHHAHLIAHGGVFASVEFHKSKHQIGSQAHQQEQF